MLLRAHMQSPYFRAKAFQVYSPNCLSFCPAQTLHRGTYARCAKCLTSSLYDDKEIVQGYCREDDSPRLHFRTPRGSAVGWDIGTKKKNVLVLPEAICTHLEFGVRRGNVHLSYVPCVAMIYHRFVLQAA